MHAESQFAPAEFDPDDDPLVDGKFIAAPPHHSFSSVRATLAPPDLEEVEEVPSSRSASEDSELASGPPSGSQIIKLRSASRRSTRSSVSAPIQSVGLILMKAPQRPRHNSPVAAPIPRRRKTTTVENPLGDTPLHGQACKLCQYRNHPYQTKSVGLIMRGRRLSRVPSKTIQMLLLVKSTRRPDSCLF